MDVEKNIKEMAEKIFEGNNVEIVKCEEREESKVECEIKVNGNKGKIVIDLEKKE